MSGDVVYALRGSQGMPTDVVKVHSHLADHGLVLRFECEDVLCEDNELQ